MSKMLTIIARIEAKVDKVEFVKAELLKLVAPTLKEEGCIQYDLHQDNDNPAVFIFFEQWESPAFLQQHASNTHIVAYKKATEGAIESSTIYKMTRISAEG